MNVIRAVDCMQIGIKDEGAHIQAGKISKFPTKIHTINPNTPSVCCHTNFRKLDVQVLPYVEENANENVTCIDF